MRIFCDKDKDYQNQEAFGIKFEKLKEKILQWQNEKNEGAQKIDFSTNVYIESKDDQEKKLKTLGLAFKSINPNPTLSQMVALLFLLEGQNYNQLTESINLKKGNFGQDYHFGDERANIIVMFVICNLLLNNQSYDLDVVINNPNLAKLTKKKLSDAGIETLSFYEDQKQDIITNDKKLRIIIGKTEDFFEQWLRKEFNFKDKESDAFRKNNITDTDLFIDQFDNCLIDNIDSYVFLSHQIEDYKFLDQLFFKIWHETKKYERVAEFARDLSLDQIKDISEVIQRNNQSGGRYPNIYPDFLKDHVNKNLELWICMAHTARIYRNGIQYKIVNKQNDRGNNRVIEIIDNHSGHVIEKKIWPDGLLQFIQIKEGCYLEKQNFPVIFSSFIKYFNSYKTINGITVHGLDSVKKFISEHYQNRSIFRVEKEEKEEVETKIESLKEFSSQEVFDILTIDNFEKEYEELKPKLKKLSEKNQVLFGEKEIDYIKSNFAKESSIYHKFDLKRKQLEEISISIITEGDAGYYPPVIIICENIKKVEFYYDELKEIFKEELREIFQIEKITEENDLEKIDSVLDDNKTIKLNQIFLTTNIIFGINKITLAEEGDLKIIFSYLPSSRIKSGLLNLKLARLKGHPAKVKFFIYGVSYSNYEEEEIINQQNEQEKESLSNLTKRIESLKVKDSLMKKYYEEIDKTCFDIKIQLQLRDYWYFWLKDFFKSDSTQEDINFETLKSSIKYTELEVQTDLKWMLPLRKLSHLLNQKPSSEKDKKFLNYYFSYYDFTLKQEKLLDIANYYYAWFLIKNELSKEINSTTRIRLIKKTIENLNKFKHSLLERKKYLFNLGGSEICILRDQTIEEQKLLEFFEKNIKELIGDKESGLQELKKKYKEVFTRLLDYDIIKPTKISKKLTIFGANFLEDKQKDECIEKLNLIFKELEELNSKKNFDHDDSQFNNNEDFITEDFKHRKKLLKEAIGDLENIKEENDWKEKRKIEMYKTSQNERNTEILKQIRKAKIEVQKIKDEFKSYLFKEGVLKDVDLSQIIIYKKTAYSDQKLISLENIPNFEEGKKELITILILNEVLKYYFKEEEERKVNEKVKQLIDNFKEKATEIYKNIRDFKVDDGTICKEVLLKKGILKAEHTNKLYFSETANNEQFRVELALLLTCFISSLPIRKFDKVQQKIKEIDLTEIDTKDTEFSELDDRKGNLLFINQIINYPKINRLYDIKIKETENILKILLKNLGVLKYKSKYDIEAFCNIESEDHKIYYKKLYSSEATRVNFHIGSEENLTSTKIIHSSGQVAKEANGNDTNSNQYSEEEAERSATSDRSRENFPSLSSSTDQVEGDNTEVREVKRVQSADSSDKESDTSASDTKIVASTLPTASEYSSLNNTIKNFLDSGNNDVSRKEFIGSIVKHQNTTNQIQEVKFPVEVIEQLTKINNEEGCLQIDASQFFEPIFSKFSRIKYKTNEKEEPFPIIELSIESESSQNTINIIFGSEKKTSLLEKCTDSLNPQKKDINESYKLEEYDKNKEKSSIYILDLFDSSNEPLTNWQQTIPHQKQYIKIKTEEDDGRRYYKINRNGDNSIIDESVIKDLLSFNYFLNFKKEIIKEIIIDDQQKEICFQLKRFDNSQNKIDKDVELDNIKINESVFKPTAFILHTGKLEEGHYVSYIKEQDGNEQKWFEYNDEKKDLVCEIKNGIPVVAKKAYIIKYSKEGTELPKAEQVAGFSNKGNYCWLNASLTFLKSFTTIREQLQSLNLTQAEKQNIKQKLGLNSDDKYNLKAHLLDLGIISNIKETSEEISSAKTNPDLWSLEDISKSDSLDLDISSNSVQLISEQNHITDHESNVKKVISLIKDGKLKQGDVIALERKEEGKNFGMEDVRYLAKIIKDKTQKDLIAHEIKNSPIYHDAILYNIATDNNIEVVGIEGSNLSIDKKIDLSQHNQERERVMIQKLKAIQESKKPETTVAIVGSKHLSNTKIHL